MAAQALYRGTGRRKTAVARVRVLPGDGKIMVNGRDYTEYFPRRAQSRRVSDTGRPGRRAQKVRSQEGPQAPAVLQALGQKRHLYCEPPPPLSGNRGGSPDVKRRRF